MPLIYEKKNRIAYLTLNRPEVKNCIDPETAVEMLAAWEDYRGDKNCLCAIITGAGDDSFCAGLDLARMIPLNTGARPPETEADRKILSDPELLDNAMLRNFKLFKPVVSAVNGFAIAGGMELVMATDIRIASDKARFGLQEARWGVFPRGGSTVRLPRQVSYCKAMEIMLTGDLIDAGEAFRIGFVNRVVPHDKVVEEAEKVALKIAQNGPLAIRAIKESVLSCMGLTEEEGLRKEAELAGPVFKSRDAREGPRAFKEKRKPQFTGE
ncbi:MAG: enoyl-CoA hydratase/isomerase family protein [Deltaproteobacteria bacterium]|nr:enoyl-CoA hydratase/isomerase family protein [Deltaproteobacteria bacterium]